MENYTMFRQLREYNLEKLSILKNINNVLNLYRIYD